MQILSRFEIENGGQLLVASLCLLEASVRGLLETELLVILADEDNLMPKETKGDEENEKGLTLATVFVLSCKKSLTSSLFDFWQQCLE